LAERLGRCACTALSRAVDTPTAVRDVLTDPSGMS
jgi:hypothetical protein